MINRNTNRFEYYIIQHLFNDINLPFCHTENLFYKNIFIPFKYTLLLFSRVCSLGTNLNGTIFSWRVRSRPSHPLSYTPVLGAEMVLKTHFFIKIFRLLYSSFVSLIRISRNIKQKLTQQLIQTN